MIGNDIKKIIIILKSISLYTEKMIGNDIKKNHNHTEKYQLI